MIFWLKQIIKMLFQQLILPAVYNVHAMKPVIPGTVILADAHHSEIPFSMWPSVRASDPSGASDHRNVLEQ